MERRAIEKYINSYSIEMPVFQNLIKIEICFGCFPGWDGVGEVLRYCPKLQNLVIEKSAYREFYKKKWAYTEPVPECILLHLKTCSIGSYQGMYEDFTFAGCCIYPAECVVLTSDDPSEYLLRGDI